MAGGFWQFFGLDPADRADLPVQSRVSMASSVTGRVEPTEASPDQDPEVWQGERTHVGGRFLDLGLPRVPPFTPPRRAVRYVRPDATGRLPLQRMEARVEEGDCLFIDLSGLVHMQAHQDAIRSELRRLGQVTGVGAWALDADDLLFLIPGLQVMMDTTKHELGGRALLPLPSG